MLRLNMQITSKKEKQGNKNEIDINYDNDACWNNVQWNTPLNSTITKSKQEVYNITNILKSFVHRLKEKTLDMFLI